MVKSLKTLYKILLVALPASVFFSYYPLISLGGNSSMNFELSLPLLILVLFDLTALVCFIALAVEQKRTTRKKPANLLSSLGPGFPGLSDRRFFLFTIFPLFATFSCFWSENPLRGLLTAGIIWAIFFAVFSIIYLTPLIWEKPQRVIIRTFLIVSTLVCIFCFVQSVLDIAGVPRESSLLCPGCTYRSFGFPHPSGFAIEPQFMGGLLLAPALLTLYLIIFKKKRRLALSLLAAFFAITLFFTFSRGAIYAFAVALVVMFIFALRRRLFRASLIIIPIVSFIISLCLQGTFAALGPSSVTFSGAINSSISQLSLGLIDLGSSEASADPEPPVDAPFHDGYVEESTNVRLGLNSLSLRTLISSPRYLLVGAGLGGAGQAMYDYSLENGESGYTIASPKEIVQNELFSILLELGIIGFLLMIFSLLLAFSPAIFPGKFLDGRSAKAFEKPSLSLWTHPALPLLLSVIVAYAITLQFFSGLPNALHIYLLPSVLYLVYRK